jgi:hypothetical protein
MNWLNIQTRTIHAPEYVGSDPTERATWFNLVVYCADQENGGRILDCRKWKDRRWQQTCGVTAEEATKECELWSWDGDDLIVWAYPLDKESEVQAKREGGRKGGTKRAQLAKNQENICQGSSSASSTPSSSASTEEKGIEGNRIEGKRGNNARDESHPSGHPPAPIEFPAEFSETHTTETANGLNALAARVMTIRPEWKIPLTYAEMRSLTECSATLEALDDTDWQSIRNFMRAKLPQGSSEWQPRTRAKFLENASDVYGHAVSWSRKNPQADSKPRTGGWK